MKTIIYSNANYSISNIALSSWNKSWQFLDDSEFQMVDTGHTHMIKYKQFQENDTGVYVYITADQNLIFMIRTHNTQHY